MAEKLFRKFLALAPDQADSELGMLGAAVGANRDDRWRRTKYDQQDSVQDFRVAVELLVFCLSLFMGAFAPRANAQGNTATVTGVVSDSSGGIIPGASVTITNTETGVQKTDTTDPSGRYTVPNLQPGFYDAVGDSPAGDSPRWLRSITNCSSALALRIDFNHAGFHHLTNGRSACRGLGRNHPEYRVHDP